MTRTGSGGRIDRTRTLQFTFDGRPLVGHPGDTVASALLANGVRVTGTSIKYGRPRGIMSAGVEEANALIAIDAPYAEPMLPATTVELVDGLVAHGLAGLGKLTGEPAAARHDSSHAHCALLVVGGGPAGLAAALTAGRAGARVLLVDDQPQAGGSLLGSSDLLDGRPALQWVEAAVSELAAMPEVRLLPRASVFGLYPDGFALALQTWPYRPDADPAGRRQRIWRIRAAQTLVAAGAHERPIAFPDNDRPGVMLASAARTYLHRFGVLAGQDVVLFTTNDTAYAAALDLADAGAQVRAVVDARPEVPEHLETACAGRGIEVRAGQVVTGTTGEQQLTGVEVAELRGGALGPVRQLPADLLLVSGGWNPAVHLFSQARGPLRFDAETGAFLPAGPLPAVRVAGSAAGTATLGEALADGQQAALDALGLPSEAKGLPAASAPAPLAPPLVLWDVPDPQDGPCRRFVDLQRDVTVADLLRATGAGMRSVEHIKRYTTLGTAHDQGKTSGTLASGLVAAALGTDPAALGTTTFRPPYTPVPFAAMAGRDRGELFDPVRVTALHSWHVEHGAEFENVGQWKRPWYYPQAGEDLEAAVRRETTAARQAVAIMDGSTLGKINVQGADAGEFLDRIYTNVISTLAVGSVRYGVMCGMDGMILDDGTVIRLSEREFLLTTTTGNAAKVMDWLEEFAQTEWPGLQVTMTSVTEHWVTIPVVGPRSRAVLAALAPDLDVSNDAFPFMTWRSAEVAGVPAMVCRISFSGELAFEINVRAWEGRYVWAAVMAAGQPHGITPYGTETMHVLRAEKGYPIIGQDTDGTVTPQDLGMSWVVSTKKAGFVGKRSHARSDTARADRKHLVGLLPVDRHRRVAEGAQLIATGVLPASPVPMLGHVTSSYSSAALQGTFALALVRGGRDLIGQRLLAWHDGDTVEVTVAGPVLYDPEGTRRDG